MELIEFETRLEKNDENDMFPYRFKNYAKVSLSFQDAKDIELIKTKLPNQFLESIDWEEGTAFFEMFHLSWKHSFRKEETIDAYYRMSDQLNEIRSESKEQLCDKKQSSLNRYHCNQHCLKRESLALVESLQSRNKYIRECIDSLSSEECELLGIKDIHPEFKEHEFIEFMNREKDSPCTGGEVIASPESAYSQGID